MKPIITLVMLLFISSLSFSQEMEIVNQNQDFKSDQKQEEFYYIAKDLDSAIGIKVADIHLKIAKTGKKNTLTPAFYALWEKANSLGANTFYTSNVNYLEDEKMYDVKVELYFMTGDEIDQNLDFYPKNLAVVIGNVNTDKENKGKSFKVNGEKETIMPYTFLTYQNEVDKEISFSVGGFFGTKVVFVGKQDRLPNFLSLGGGTLVPPTMVGQGTSIAFTLGTIQPVDMNFGLFLMDVLSVEKKGGM